MGGDVMKIEYSLWQGSNLLSVLNKAESMTEIDNLIKELNKSDCANKVKFSANIMSIKVGN